MTTKIVGTSPKRKEDLPLMTGAGLYTDDLRLPDTAHMAVVRSPYARARIGRIDSSLALEHPEVLAVLTGEEVRKQCKNPVRLYGVREGVKALSIAPMAVDMAKYVGEPVAAVVAASHEAARDAVDLVDVEYEPLVAVVDPERAMEADSPLVHDAMGTNVCVESSTTAGDPDEAFARADGVISVRLVQPRVVPNPMEPRAVVAQHDRETGKTTLWMSTQAPHEERTILAEVLGIPEDDVRVIAPDVGGGFGCKMSPYPETIIATILSRQLSRPIRWTEERQEHFVSTVQGRGEIQDVEAAYAKDGTLLGMRLHYYTDMGAYCNLTSHVIVERLTPAGTQGAYGVKDLTWSCSGVYTNKVQMGPYRGYGQHASAYAVERVMDLIARELHMDPAEVRRRNFISPDEFPYRTPTESVYDSGRYGEALDRALQLAEYDELRKEQQRLRGEGALMGIGLATTVDAAGFGPSGALSARPAFESAAVRVEETGRVTVAIGSSPHGQGLVTALSQIVSDELGVPFEDVDVVHGDTSVIARGVGTFASRSLVVGGTAAFEASRQVLEKARQIAASLLRIDEQHVVMEGGRFLAEDIPDRQVTWAEVARSAHRGPDGEGGGLEATVDWLPPAYTYPYSANVAVVRIDPETGEVTLVKYVAVDDCGTVVNPMIVEGQIHGGLAQGIGIALQEEVVWDENGQSLTGSFMDYSIPVAGQLPMFTLERMETPSPHNPLGAKGIGESGTVAAVPTIVNAVVDALAHLGVTHVDIPVTPEKVWRILKEKGVVG